MTYKSEPATIHPSDLEQASNSYLMAIVAVVAGLPLPIINTIASLIYYAAHKKSSYFVRWHCIQSILAQAIMIPFNSFAFAWTMKIVLSNVNYFEQDTLKEYSSESIFASEIFYAASIYYWLYIAVVTIFNIAEFISVIITAAQVRKGKNVRWFIIANLTDALTSKQNRDPYTI